MQNEEELKVMIDNAQKLHGHLGPFLVIGVRMGMIAKKALSVSDDQCGFLKANGKVPLFPPFSCLLRRNPNLYHLHRGQPATDYRKFGGDMRELCEAKRKLGQ